MITRSHVREPAGDLAQLLGFELSAEQIAAATAPLVPGLIMAGAGTGKTTVMAARVVWLVSQGSVEPNAVLGLTFTNKAAGQLRERFEKALRRANLTSDSSGTLTSTYHGFAASMLREYGPLLGIEGGGEVMSTVAQHQLAHAIACSHTPPAGWTPRPADLAGKVVELDSALADSAVDPNDLVDFANLQAKQLSGSKQQRIGQDMLETAARRAHLAQLVQAFRAAKADRGLVDFADYTRHALALAALPAVAAQLRSRHRVLLLDEYQDTSIAQRKLLTALFGDGHAITAVGDPGQAIYAWRGASSRNMDQFAEHFGHSGTADALRTYPLSVNRRSDRMILDAANDVAVPLRQRHQDLRPLTPVSDRPAGTVRAAVLPTPRQELTWAAERIAELHEAGSAWAQIAVLARANDSLTDFAETLADRGIPTASLAETVSWRCLMSPRSWPGCDCSTTGATTELCCGC